MQAKSARNVSYKGVFHSRTYDLFTNTDNLWQTDKIWRYTGMMKVQVQREAERHKFPADCFQESARDINLLMCNSSISNNSIWSESWNLWFIALICRQRMTTLYLTFDFICIILLTKVMSFLPWYMKHFTDKRRK